MNDAAYSNSSINRDTIGRAKDVRLLMNNNTVYTFFTMHIYILIRRNYKLYHKYVIIYNYRFTFMITR